MSNRPRITFDIDPDDYEKIIQYLPISMRSKMLRGFMRFILTHTNILTIANVNDIEQGNFTCLIKNQLEKDNGINGIIVSSEKTDTSERDINKSVFKGDTFI